MFKLMLVDDEMPTRRRIFKGVQWAQLGIADVREAEDGHAALALCETFEPDILLTDIRMPVMDGIELASRLTKRFPLMKVIFISGYTDKEYLKGAIRLSAVSYIEKPIRLAEVHDAVAAAVTKLREEAETEWKVTAFEQDRMAADYGKLAAALCQKPADKETVPHTLPPFFHTSTLFVCVLVKVLSHPGEDDFSIVAHSMVRTVYEIHRTGTAQTFSPLCAWREGHLVIQLAGRKTASNYNNYLNVDQFCSFLVKRFMNLGIDIAVGVGSLEGSSGKLYKSYETAMLTIQQLFFQGDESIAYYRNDFGTGYHFQDEQKQDFTQLLKRESATPAVRFLRSLAADIKHSTNTLVSSAHRFYFDLFRILIEQAETEEVPLPDSLPASPAALWQRITLAASLDALTDYLISGVESYFSALSHACTANPVIGSALRLIRKRYSDPNLCITMLSQHCGLSPAYFCRIFHRETGKTPNHYILDYRMKKAEILLENPKCKVKEIASLVGYRDGNYFSAQFKHHVGETPSEYRERVL